jgi:hypothetical protein
MHGKFPTIQQNQRNSILFHETIPLILNIRLTILTDWFLFTFRNAFTLFLFHNGGFHANSGIPHFLPFFTPLLFLRIYAYLRMSRTWSSGRRRRAPSTRRCGAPRNYANPCHGPAHGSPSKTSPTRCTRNRWVGYVCGICTFSNSVRGICVFAIKSFPGISVRHWRICNLCKGVCQSRWTRFRWLL